MSAHDPDSSLPYPAHAKLTPKEAASYLGIPASRLDRWRKEGRIAFLQPTVKTVLYRAADLYDFEEGSRVEPRAKPAGKRKPKSVQHRRAIAAGQRAAWARRKARGGDGT
jgi:excisionase family DNA binding protein